MSEKTIHVCDGCDKILEKASGNYHMEFRSGTFWNSAETDYNQINLEFCEHCARHIKQTLDNIANRDTMGGLNGHQKPD